jgi:hypothetical protein
MICVCLELPTTIQREARHVQCDGATANIVVGMSKYISKYLNCLQRTCAVQMKPPPLLVWIEIG